MANLEPLLPGVLDITIHVPLRVHDGRDPCVLIGDQVRRVRQAIQVVLLEDHRDLPACMRRMAATNASISSVVL